MMPGSKKSQASKPATRKSVATTRKATSAKSLKNANLKTKPTAASVSAFISAVENETRRRDAKTILAMMKTLTGEKPRLWGPSIIGFGQYHYQYESGREGDMFAVGFSPRKANTVLYVLGSLKDNDPLLSRLGKYKRGRACLYINTLDEIDLDVLERIIKKSYETTKKKWAGGPAQ
ncbi:MAG: DUF1801 domain-containing protein [Hyphococcus sp.]